MGSLRQAILDSNAQGPGPNAIDFDIAPAGAQVIFPLSPLPVIAVPATIDGMTQPGFVGLPLIKLDGSGAGSGVNGVVIAGGGSVLRGILIVDFSGAGVVFSTNGGDVVENDLIGVDVGAVPAGNGGDGVRVMASDNSVGSLGGAPDLIAYNGGFGVEVTAGTNNSIESNSIHSNAAGGILTAPGTNDDLAAPTITGASSDGGSTAIQGTVAGVPSTTYRVEFFSNPVCDASGAGQGRIPLGSVSVATDSGGSGAFAAVESVGTTPGQVITATATNAGGSTSQFSSCQPVSDNHYCSIRRADLNADGMVNSADLTLFAGQFGRSVPPASVRADQNGDGVINVQDLVLFAKSFALSVTSCP